MLIQTRFKAKVLNSFEKEFSNKNSGQSGKYYQLGVMTEDGLATLKCSKDVHAVVSAGGVVPMSECDFLAVFDPDKKDFRVVDVLG